MLMAEVGVESKFYLNELSLVPLDFKDNCPAVRSMTSSCIDMYEISGVLVSFMFAKGLMDSRVDELFMVLLIAKREDYIPVSCEVLVVFKMD